MIQRRVQSEKRRVKTQSLKFYVLSFGFALCALSFTLLVGCQNQQLYKDSRIVMGTFVEVSSPDKEAAKVAFTEIKRIEGLLSKYREDSEVVRLNKRGELKVGPDTLYILQKAEEFWQLSDGAFDITVGPLMDLWGFTDKKYYLPRDEEIKEALNLVGFDKIIFNNAENVVKFSVQGMKIDLGAVAKGYAIDCAVKKLKEKGIKDCLINAGGDIYALGDIKGKSWKVAVKDPRHAAFLQRLELKNKAVATSGDYEQFFIQGNRRYAHIFNPKTGYPLDSGVVSVTVIAPDCLTADALATSIFVLGKEKGSTLVEKRFPDVRVKIIESKDVPNNS
ncbi:MAG: FAD:protein FMN transferase [Candidatus Omnitrophica bacterium]|nr:FAD:protein FMN transferase [Candidatus Omnitrophota bacterium]